MIHRLLLCALLFHSVFFTQAQFTHHGPSDVYYVGQIMAGHNNRVFATTTSGLYVSDSFGDTWTKVNQFFNNPQFHSPLIKADDGMLYTWDANGIYRSTDNGESFRPQYMYLTNTTVTALGLFAAKVWMGTPNGLLSAHASDVITKTDAVAGFEGKVIKTINISGSHIIVGTKTGIYVSTDGVDWKLKATGLPAQEFNFISIEITEGKVFLGTDAGVYYTDDWGDHWYGKNDGLSNTYILDLYIDNGKIVAATGSYNGLYTSSTDGSAWTFVENPFEMRFAPTAVFKRGDNLLVGGWHDIFKSADNGAHWQQSKTGVRDVFEFTSMQQGPDGSLYALANGTGIYKKASGESEFEPLVLLDGGRVGRGNIIDNKIPVVYGYSMKFYDITTGTPVSDPILYPITLWPDVLLNTKKGYFLSSLTEGIYQQLSSTDWIPYNSGLGSLEVFDLDLAADSLLYASTGDGLYKSNINKGTWTKLNIPGNDLALRNLFIHENAMIASSDYKSFVSNDAGKTWTRIRIPAPTYPDGVDLAFVQDIIYHDHSLYLTTASAIYYSDDMGNTWYQSSLDEHFYFQTMIVQNEIMYIAANETGVVSIPLSRLRQPVMAIDEEHNEKVTVYANPGNGRYDVQLPDAAAFSSPRFLICDMLGKPVAFALDNHGSGHYKLDIGQAPNGFYLLRVQTQHNLVTLRVVKE